MAIRTRRTVIMALVCIMVLSFQNILKSGGLILTDPTEGPPDINSLNNNTKKSRLEYIRSPGNEDGLLQIFEGIVRNGTKQQLPRTAKEIAEKYGIPETSRDIQCNTGATAVTVGWIPSEPTYYNMSLSNTPYTYKGKIPRIIFQSWKTNELSSDLCNHVFYWPNMNPQYDYFLFDDDAIDRFIQLEYGEAIFSSYACVKVGAAMCDVWRILIVYLYGGLYFDFDTRLAVPLEDWNWGNDRDVVTGRSCNIKKHPGGCAHQWGLVYAPKHPVLYRSIKETLSNLANRKAVHVYDISFWSYYNAWRNSPYNQSYMPGWGEAFGGRIHFQNNDVKDVMVENATHWQVQKQIWHPECLK